MENKLKTWIPRPIINPVPDCVTFITEKYKDRATELIEVLPRGSLVFIDLNLDITQVEFPKGIAVSYSDNAKQRFFKFIAALPPTKNLDPIIGEGCTIHPTAVIYPNVVIGDRCIIKANAVIGGDGFGYIGNMRIRNFGRVVIGNDTHIGSCTCIDRGTLGDTVIGNDVHIDNLVHIAHNVTIHDNATVIACSMIAGSVEIGEGAWVAPSASVRNGVSIGAKAVVGLGAVVVKSVDEGQTVMGNPAMAEKDFTAMRNKIKAL